MELARGDGLQRIGVVVAALLGLQVTASGCKRRRQTPSLKRPEYLVAPERKYIGS